MVEQVSVLKFAVLKASATKTHFVVGNAPIKFSVCSLSFFKIHFALFHRILPVR
jgi:hypothetical protein